MNKEHRTFKKLQKKKKKKVLKQSLKQSKQHEDLKKVIKQGFFQKLLTAIGYDTLR